MKTLFLMFYEIAADGLARVPAHMVAHQQRLQDFKVRGTLLMAGPYGAPPVGALGVFTDRAAAEEFVREDPFVVNGVVAKVTLQPWSEALG